MIKSKLMFYRGEIPTVNKKGVEKMAINLSKGQKIDLSKDGKSFNKLMVGLGWDEAAKSVPVSNGKSSGGFFGRLFGAAEQVVSRATIQDIDCDASVICLGENGRLVPGDPSNTMLYFGNQRMFGGALKHGGDNLTGAGKGDDETIDVRLSDIPDYVSRLVFVVNIYQAESRNQHFGMIKNCYIRIINKDTGEELCRFNLSENYDNMEGMIVAEIYRYKGNWKFGTIGQPLRNASVLNQVLDRYR